MWLAWVIKLVDLIDLGGKVHLADKVSQSFWMMMLFCCMVVLVDLSAKVKVNMVDLVEPYLDFKKKRNDGHSL